MASHAVVCVSFFCARRDPEQERLLSRGLTSLVVRTIQSARALSTRSMYSLKCCVFKSWCTLAALRSSWCACSLLQETPGSFYVLTPFMCLYVQITGYQSAFLRPLRSEPGLKAICPVRAFHACAHTFCASTPSGCRSSSMCVLGLKQ